MGSGSGDSVEVSAKTVDEAVAQALKLLGCARADVQVEVLHPGSPGRLLGFGAEPARVRATRADSEVAAAFGPGTAGPPDTSTAATGTVDVAAPVDDEIGRSNEHLDESDESVDEGAREGEAELARLMLAELLNRMGLAETRVVVRATEPVTLDIQGGDVADLIGRRGENLRSLQFILSLMLNKQLKRHLRIVVDVDGYRARREELLRGMAQRFAHRVRTLRQPMQLEAMPPNERRIIHLALADDPEVLTESTGEGDARRVVIKLRR
jgi:spoIIIJ-associated protein